MSRGSMWGKFYGGNIFKSGVNFHEGMSAVMFLECPGALFGNFSGLKFSRKYIFHEGTFRKNVRWWLSGFSCRIKRIHI